MPNIFRQAYEIITTKTGDEMTKKERKLVGIAVTFIATQLVRVEPEYDELPISDGLLRLAKIAEEVL